MNFFFVLRIAFCMAKDPIFATFLSTTLVNSSNTNNSLSVRIARAKSHRIFSPLLSTEYGFNQDGTDANPTLVSVRVISCILADAGISSSKLSCVYSKRSIYAFGNNSRAIVVLPVPLAPTIIPICQSFLGVISPVNRSAHLLFCKSYVPITLATRNVLAGVVSLIMSKDGIRTPPLLVC